jgi:molybdenum cofactor cytidylyltransferase
MNVVTLPRLQVVILSAGLSSRMGRPKALACIRGLSLLRKTLQLLAPLVRAQIIVVLPEKSLRYRIEARGFNATFVANPQRAAGLSSSVRRGLLQARYSSAALLLPVDLPALRRRDIARLIARWRAQRRCVAARRIGRPGGPWHGGTPLILPRWLYARALAVTGDMGLRELVGGLPAQQRILLDLPSAALDVDTPRDLASARRRLRPAG